jgi:transcriptional regulator with XRE-family HTH domain
MEKDIKQAELAQRCSISASYLNLIEHNRRKIGGGLLLKIAQALDVDPAMFSETAEVELARSLEAAASAFSFTNPERDRAQELAGRFPGWARLIFAQQAELGRLQQVVERLGDRLTHDPFLSASMHNVLSSVTAIRSASAILANGGEIEPEWEARFHRNIFEDSQRLTDATETLVRYLDNENGPAEGSLPQDELDAWLANQGWRIEALEREPAAQLDTILDAADDLTTAAARDIAASFLRRYQDDVRLLPEASLLNALSETQDALQLAANFALPLPVIFRRLATVSKDSLPEGNPFGLVACDGSGTLTVRKPLPEFTLPRYGACCPFWPLFQSLQTPLTPVMQIVALSGQDKADFRTIAFAEKSYPLGWDGPATLQAWMLFQPVIEPDASRLRVGISCRVCAEQNCVARREPSVFA